MNYQRCFKIFEESIKSEITKRDYKYLLEKFRKWTGYAEYDDLLRADQKSIQRLIEDYVIYLKHKISPNSFTVQLAPLFLFYQVNDVTLNTVRIKKMCPSKIKRAGYSAYTRDAVKLMLNSTTKKRTKALIFFLASTGCRVSAMTDLKMKDLEQMPNGCKSVTFYSGDMAEYIGFLTPEACQALENYLEERIQDGEKITSESPVFRRKYVVASLPAIALTRTMVTELMKTVIKDIKRKRDSSCRFNIPLLHGFRKFFNITLKSRPDANLSICEKLLGHSTTIPLDNHYLPLEKEALFEEFKKAIPYLTISEEKRQQDKINKLQAEKTELREKNQKYELAKTELELTKLEIEKIKLEKEHLKSDKFEINKTLLKLLIQFFITGKKPDIPTEILQKLISEMDG